MVDGQQETHVIDDVIDDDRAERPSDASDDASGAENETGSAAARVSDGDAEVAGATTPAGDGDADAEDEAEGEAGAEADADAEDDAEDDDDQAEDAESVSPLDLEGEVAADYLEELLDIADLDGDIDTYVENGRAHVSVLTDSDVLVGKDGEVLDALQELARLAVITETGNRSRLMLDIAGYRERRRKTLTALATDAVEEVKNSGEAVRLAPMNPFERKIVHDVVAGAGLSSESEGEEPQRRVVILPAS